MLSEQTFYKIKQTLQSIASSSIVTLSSAMLLIQDISHNNGICDDVCGVTPRNLAVMQSTMPRYMWQTLEVVICPAFSES